MKKLSAALEFSFEHPALHGHFPDNPIVPAVLLLDEVLHRLESAPNLSVAAASSRGWQMDSAKFYRPVRPGETLALELETCADGSVRFVLSCSEALVARGSLLPAPARRGS